MKFLLKAISKKAIALSKESFSEAEIENNWIGKTPATEIAIKITEQRLGVSLPDDVKEFYKTSNGTSVVCKNTFGGFMPIEQIDWLINIQKQTLTDYSEMPERYLEDLRNVIIISGINDAHQVFIIQPYGEYTSWRYWEFAFYFPGERVIDGIKSYLERLDDFLSEQIINKINESTK